MVCPMHYAPFVLAVPWAFGKMKKMDTYELAALALLVLPMLAMVAGYLYKPEVAQQLTQCATSCSAMSGVGILWLLGVKTVAEMSPNASKAAEAEKPKAA